VVMDIDEATRVHQALILDKASLDKKSEDYGDVEVSSYIEG